MTLQTLMKTAKLSGLIPIIIIDNKRIDKHDDLDLTNICYDLVHTKNNNKDYLNIIIFTKIKLLTSYLVTNYNMLTDYISDKEYRC